MYGYSELERDRERYTCLGAETTVIGKSVEGRDIVCFCVGEGGSTVLSTAAIHARENASAHVVTAQIRAALKAPKGFRRLFVPLVNPDGAEAVIRAAECGDSKGMLVKSNARGVDLNVNFDARWGSGEQNVFARGDANFVGEKPFSEPESAALREIVERENVKLTLSYHTMGRELYWYFFQKENLGRDFALARYIESYLKHAYRRIDSDLGSAGGFKDWCIEKKGISAFTLELGEGVHPLKEKDLKEDIALNRYLVEALSERINDDRRRLHETCPRRSI